MSCISMFVIWTAFQSIRRHREDGLGFTTTTNWIFLWDWIDIFLSNLNTIDDISWISGQSQLNLWVTDFIFPLIVLWMTDLTGQTWMNPSGLNPKTSSWVGSKEVGEGGWSASDGLVTGLHSFPSFYCIAQGHFTGAARTKESIFAHISSPNPSSRGFSCCFKHTKSTPVPRTSIKPAQLCNFHMEMHKHAPWHRTDNRQIVPAVHFLCSYSGAGEDQQ